ncbi:MAG: DUF4178 domain-containing protein [Planctomycetales bacterium]|nr:DUF4178 domain-containing protein [Planctomycetales bacterium]
MSFQGQCPTCGAPIEFGFDTSLVTICDSCHTIAGRGDGKLESYGQVADLVQTDSPLRVGLSGKVKDVPFVVTGRAQLKHAAGGVWDEWYVAFRDGQRWGWLAEAQGRYYLTFPKELPSSFEFDFDGALLESEISIPQVGKLKVVEIGQSTAISAEGEIPYEFHPGETVTYADLQGEKGRFATIDNSESPPAFYLGGEFSLEKLGISPQAASREQDEREVSSVGISCPNCGGALEQRCPESLRIVCPYCDSMLDVSEGQGSLKFLEKLGKQKIKPVIPLGTVGELRGRKYTVIGFMRRKVTVNGVDYPWQEYLLYTPRQDFHWLIHSESHWSLGKPMSAGHVKVGGGTADCEGRTYKVFSHSLPHVTHVLGEFYWEVRKGERTMSDDYVSPPYMLSREESSTNYSGITEAQQKEREQVPIYDPRTAMLEQAAAPEPPPVRPKPAAREVNYTVSEYLQPSEVEAAFGVKGLRRPTGVAPNQPYPHKGIYPLAFIFFLVAFLLATLFFMTGSRKVVYTRNLRLAPEELSPSGSLVLFPEEQIEIRGGRNIQVTLESPVDNSWVYVAGDFFEESAGTTYPFDAEVAYYHGYSGGESWSEGGRRKRRYVSSLPSGKYSMRLEFQWDRAKQPSTSATLTIRQGVPRILNLFLTLLALAVIPGIIGIHHGTFESRRWAESDFSD